MLPPHDLQSSPSPTVKAPLLFLQAREMLFLLSTLLFSGAIGFAPVLEGKFAAVRARAITSSYVAPRDDKRHADRRLQRIAGRGK